MPSKTTLLWFHSSIWKKEEISPGQKLKVDQIESGGTQYGPIFNEVNKMLTKPQALIWLTDLFPNDGFGEKPNYKVVWGSVTKDRKAPYGESIYIEVEN